MLRYPTIRKAKHRAHHLRETGEDEAVQRGDIGYNGEVGVPNKTS